jgi:hypothetical protein
MPEKEYQRLTRARSRTAFGAVSVSRSCLWQGKDHLLRIDSSGYTESYKRFYFRDIQAVTIVATKRRVVLNGVLLVPLVICLVGLATNLFPLPKGNAAASIAWAVFTVIFAVPLLINNMLGPTCTCYLRTAVQTEELSSLNRVRRARKVLDRIRPLITAAQGSQPPPGELSARMQGLAQSFAGGSVAPGSTAPPSPAADNPPAPPRLA